MTTNSILYSSPVAEVIEATAQYVVCTSGDQSLGFGDNKDYGYEDW